MATAVGYGFQEARRVLGLRRLAAKNFRNRAQADVDRRMNQRALSLRGRGLRSSETMSGATVSRSVR